MRKLALNIAEALIVCKAIECENEICRAMGVPESHHMKSTVKIDGPEPMLDLEDADEQRSLYNKIADSAFVHETLFNDEFRDAQKTLLVKFRQPLF